MRKNLVLLVLAGSLFAAFAATSAGARSEGGVFPGRARCGFSNFYVDYRQPFPTLPPQISIFTRDPNGHWNLVLWYKFQGGLYWYQIYPGCTNGKRVRTIPTQATNVVGRAGGIGRYALHCRYHDAVEIQQQYGAGGSILYLASGHTNRAYVRTIFDAKHTQVAFNRNFCQLTTRDLPVSPV